ncbi:MAG: hypothetical protein U9R79_02680 [Armatimonadota bacterium]|nr:hypothetical protein [Armatimonadota bacterium]
MVEGERRVSVVGVRAVMGLAHGGGQRGLEPDDAEKVGQSIW